MLFTSKRVLAHRDTTENIPLRTALRQYITVLCARASQTNNEQKVKVVCSSLLFGFFLGVDFQINKEKIQN